MSPLLRKNGVFRLYPKKLNYLFLAVFAFSEAFCYAKTTFSYSPDILFPCTPILFMVKDVVKCEKWACSTLETGKNKPIDYIAKTRDFARVCEKIEKAPQLIDA